MEDGAGGGSQLVSPGEGPSTKDKSSRKEGMEVTPANGNLRNNLTAGCY